MIYFSEFAGSIIFLLAGYAYTCNITLPKTLIGRLSYIELAIAWSTAVGFGITAATVMGGPALLNPGAAIGNVITGGITAGDALVFILMEFLAAGAAEALCMIFFWDSFKAAENVPKRGIFSAYPAEKNIPLNFVQEMLATFFFFFSLLTVQQTVSGENKELLLGFTGFAAVMLLSLSLNSTGFSMNAMRSVFSSVWFAILPFPNKNGEKPDWQYQLTVNLVGSSLGAVLAVVSVNMIFK